MTLNDMLICLQYIDENLELAEALIERGDDETANKIIIQTYIQLLDKSIDFKTLKEFERLSHTIDQRMTRLEKCIKK